MKQWRKIGKKYEISIFCQFFSPNFWISRGQKLNTNFFFSNFSGTAGISQRNPGISRQKSLISLVSRDIPNFLAPTPSCGRPLPHRKISGLRIQLSLGLGSFFVPDKSGLLYSVVAKTLARYRRHLAPLGPKCRKESETSSRGLSAPRAQKVPNGVGKESKQLKKKSILTRFRLRLGLFGPPEPRGSQNSFRTLFATLGHFGPK